MASLFTKKPIYGCQPKNMGKPPNHPILIGFSIIFTIHFGGITTPIFGNTPIYRTWKHLQNPSKLHRVHQQLWRLFRNRNQGIGQNQGFGTLHPQNLTNEYLVQWLFLVPRKGGRWHIIPQLAVYTTYILPPGGLYATYHLLGEPETTID